MNHELTSHVEAVGVDADEDRRLRKDTARPLNDSAKVVAARVERLAQGRLGGRERIGHGHRDPVDEEPPEPRRLDCEDRPADIDGIAVVRAPTVAEVSLRTPLVELFEGHHDLDRTVLLGRALVGQVEHAVGGLDHRNHHGRDELAVGREDDGEVAHVLVEAQHAPKVRPREAVGGKDGGIHGRSARMRPGKLPALAATRKAATKVPVSLHSALMTHIAVSIAPESSRDVAAALERAAAAVEAGATLVEWRIDLFAHEPDAVRTATRLVRESPAPCIVTCRPVWEGGHYDGDDDARVSLLEAIGTSDAAPRYLDFELVAYRRSANLRQKVGLVVDHARQARDLKTSLILSSHHLDGRPSDLARRVSAMADAEACAVIKVAWRARSLRDNLEAFELLRHRRKPMIALCMGEFGLMSRVLAKKFGALLSFASADGSDATAPGQVSVQTMREAYRWDAIGAETRVYGVAGWPVAHSRSPLLHNSGFDAVGHDGVYLPLPIPSEWEHWKATIGSLVDDRALHFAGASVTLPHKEHLLRFVVERGGAPDEASRVIGAANTLVVRDDGSLACMNTDAPAAVATLIEEGVEVEGARAAVLGAGGAARAVAWGLAHAGATVTVFNRSKERAERLASDLHGRPRADGGTAKVVVGRLDAISCGCFPLVVNCTSVGMQGGPAPDESPLPADFPFVGTTIFETVYAPTVTPLVATARAGGARLVGGLGMFLRQAAIQFEAWTGRAAPLELWRALLAKDGA